MERRSGPTRLPASAPFWLAHAAFWLAAFAANMLLVAVFSVDDPPGFIALEIALCFLCTAAMRALSRREPLLGGSACRRRGCSRAG